MEGIHPHQAGREAESELGREGGRELCRQSDLDKGPGAHRPIHRGREREGAEMGGEGLE